MSLVRCRYRRLLVALVALMALTAVTAGARADDLTPTERRWLQGIWPVVVFARAERLPLDIVVQPQPTPGQAPLALGFVDGRCKLVLSMRANPAAERTLSQMDPALLDPVLELMAAHELGHCRRYLDGAWYDLPAGFAAAAGTPGDEAPAARREEAYGDLVGLAWIERRHPSRFDAIHRWLTAERTADRIPGSPHDTLAWVRLAQGGVGEAEASMFAAAHRLWCVGIGSAAHDPARTR